MCPSSPPLFILGLPDFTYVIAPLSCGELVCDPLSVSSLLSPPVLAELQQARLVTSEECEGLYNPSVVVKVQNGKSHEIQAKTADVLRTHGYTKESNLLSGKQTQLLVQVESSCKGHSKATIINVSVLHPVLGYWCVLLCDCLLCPLSLVSSSCC